MNRPAHAHPHKVIACREYDIVVPFVCHRCGNCCRKYEPIIEMELLPEIAWCLGEPIYVIQSRLHVDNLSHSAGRPTDCCFLDPLHSRCLIYAVRPTECRQFPALAGVGAVDCPGYREYISVMSEFTARLKDDPRSPAPAARGRRQMSPDAREDVLHSLRVSDTYREVFEALNA
jgi:Fe-S-cluster containining protein